MERILEFEIGYQVIITMSVFLTGFEPLNTNLIYFWIYRMAKVLIFHVKSNLNKDKNRSTSFVGGCFINLCSFADLFRTTFPVSGGGYISLSVLTVIG